MSDVEQEIAEQMVDEEETASASDDDSLGGEDDGEGVDGAAAATPPPRSQKEIDELTKKLEAEATRHEKRVAEIMGDDFSLLVASPVDWTPGFIFAVPEMLPSPDQVAALMALLGQSPAYELRDAEDAQGCEKCNALGEVKTGSRKPGQETKPCSACSGTGWTTRLQMPTPTVQLVPAQNGYTEPTAAPNQFQVADRWGRPFGHPHYNLEPASVGA